MWQPPLQINREIGHLSITNLHTVIKVADGTWLVMTRDGNVFVASRSQEEYVFTIKKIISAMSVATGYMPSLKETKDDVDTFWER